MKSASRIRGLGLMAALSAWACVSHPPGQVDENGDECPLTAPRGEVTLVAYPGEAWVGLTVVGRFQRSTPVREAFNCERRTVGPCEVTTCQARPLDFVNGEPACGSTSAGSLLISRGDMALPRVEGSAQLTLDHALSPGEPFTVRTTGGDVPAFSATVHLPQRTTVTSPEPLTRGGMVSVATGAELAVGWTPTPSRVLVIVTESGGASFNAECAFDGTAGSGVVPAGALPANPGHVEVWTEDRIDQPVGAFPVTVRARWSMGSGATLLRDR
jgi:hypothetical protein